jgi:EAL domain-containing protein (putative c-di-GMP-specific phosphodiesterase class I)
MSISVSKPVSLGVAAFAVIAVAICVSTEVGILSGTLIAVFGAVALFALHRDWTLRRQLTDALGDHVDLRSSNRQIIARLGADLQAMKHRLNQSNSTTGLPTREHLFSAIAADMGHEGRRHTLGLIHFSEYDRLLALDGDSARRALADIAGRIARAASTRHCVCQVDRATLAIWFRGGSAAEELQAIAYVARQQIAIGETVLTPSLTCSAIELPPEGASPDALLARAVAALPVREAASSVAVSPQGIEEERHSFALEQGLAHAIEREQLAMVFQPVVDLAADRVVGAEALMRWSHPEFGPVSPALFIPMVERLGLSDRYGLWALNAACREAASWRKQGLGGLRMAVNLSARQVLDLDLEAKIERTVLRHGLDMGALELELTETAVMADAQRTFALFPRLRAKGVSLAIDDFGAGYSSLSYLKNLPFSKLKIDREFVTDIDKLASSRAICRALIELGAGLGLTVLAEGVETAEEVATLRRLGCRVFQGFYFSRPLPAEAFADFVRTAPWRAATSIPVPCEASA